MRKDRKARRWWTLPALAVTAAFFAAWPQAPARAVTVDWSQSAVRGVRNCAAYRSPYHPGRGGCYWHSVDKRLESALPKICSLSRPLSVPPVGDIYTIPHASAYANPSRVSPYTGDRGFLGARIDQTITEKFSELKRKFCRNDTVVATSGSGGASGSRTGGSSAAGTGRWLSGMHCWTASPEILGNWRGRPIEIAQLFASADSWSQLVAVTGSIRNFASTHRGMQLVVHLPLLTWQSKADFSGCAHGRYDGYYRRVADALVANGFEDAIVRLGGEFNGNWHPYSASVDPVGYVRCFRRAVSVIRQRGPRLRIEWPVNRTGRGTNAKAVVDRYWPGDGYVDIVGLSLYDFWPSAKDPATWSYWFEDELKWWASFVRSKHKKLAFSEWGLMRRADGFDNPYFIEKMRDFFEANADIMSHEILWNCPSTRSNVYPANTNPRASAAYRRRW